MKKLFSWSFTGLAIASLIIFGLYGLILSMIIVNKAAGFWGFTVAFFIFPVTFTVAPWFALIAWGDLFPLLITYGGGIVTALLFGIASKFWNKE